MNEQGESYFRAIAERYRAAGCPPHGNWHFDNGEIGERHRELETAGLVQRAFGVVGGFAWRLTDAGAERAKLG